MQKRNTKKVGAKAVSRETPLARSKKMTTGKPVITPGNGCTRIRHREYVCDVTSVTASMHFDSRPLNPGVSDTFPWLSGIANQYEEYVFRSLKFEYVSRLPATVGGFLAMVVDYDALDTVPTSKQQMLTYAGCVSEVIWKDLSFQADPSHFTRPYSRRFTRAGVHDVTDVKTYDLGNFVLATNAPTNLTNGELFVEYDVELYVPQLRVNVEDSSYSSGTTPSPYPAVVPPQSVSQPFLNVTGNLPFSVGNDEQGKTLLTFVNDFMGKIELGARAGTGASLGVTAWSPDSSLKYIESLGVLNGASNLVGSWFVNAAKGSMMTIAQTTAGVNILGSLLSAYGGQRGSFLNTQWW